jgi:hypothetical protein
MEKRWAWWNEPEIPEMMGSLKQEDCGAGLPRQNLPTN